MTDPHPHPHPHPNANSDLHQLIEAKRIFLAARGMGLAQREDFIAAECAGNAPLRTLVFELLGADDAPLPYESLADDIRAARDHLDATPTADTHIAASTRAAFGEHAGDRIGRYHLLERIGEGGFGVVYLAQQEEPVKRRVALKILKLGMDTKQVVARFEAERQALALMDHAGIAKVFDAGATEKGRPYFVMELVKGVPITEYCDAHRLSIRDRLELVAQVCDAIQHAHQKGVIHRDIKPSNIIVSTVGDKPHAKVIDFGIAKATSARLTEKTVFTEFRQMIGTPEYMSPEQAGTSGEDIDTRTDVYSLGVLLYELLSGVTPFDAKRLRSAAYGEMQRIIREEDPPKPSTRLTKNTQTLGTIASQRAMAAEKLPRVLRGELDWIVMKTLEKDRTRRYDSAGSMGRDIQRYLNGDAVQAAPPSAAYRARKFVQRNKGAVVAASLLAGALIAGLIGTTYGLINANLQRREAITQRTRADERTQDAIREKSRADEKASEALASQAYANRSAYAANTLSASAALDANQISLAASFLDAAPKELRGWEWHTLAARLDTSSKSIACPLVNTLPDSYKDGFYMDLIPRPDGKSFLTTTLLSDPAAQLWDISSGALLATYPNPMPGTTMTDSNTYGGLSVDGERFICVGGLLTPGVTNVMDIWTSPDRRERLTIPPLGNTPIFGVGPDGRSLIRAEGSVLSLQDVASGKVVASRDMKHALNILGRFSKDGKFYVQFGIRGEVDILESATLEPVFSHRGHRNLVHAVDFSPDLRRVATCGIDGTAQIVTLPSGSTSESASSPLPIVLEHGTAVENVKFSPDGNLLATMSGDRTIRVWDVSDEGLQHAASQNIGRHTADLVASFTSSKLIPAPLMFTTDGKSVAGREEDGTVRFWDLGAERGVKLRGHMGLLNMAMYSPASGLIVSIGWDGWKGHPGCIRLWDAETGEPVSSLGEKGEVAYQMAMSPDGRYAVIRVTMTNSPWSPPDRVEDHSLLLLDLLTGQVTRKHIDRIVPQNFSIDALTFDPSGRTLTYGRDARVHTLEVPSLAEKRSCDLASYGSGISRLRISPDGNRLVLSFGIVAPTNPNPSARSLVLDARTLEVLRLLESESGLGIAFTPDSKTVLVGSRGGQIEAFAIDSGTKILDFNAHDSVVMTINFNADGTRLATVGGNEGNVTIWDSSRFPSVDRVARFHYDDFVSSAEWSHGTPSSERLLCTFGRTIRIFEPVPIRDRVAACVERSNVIAALEPRLTRLLARENDRDRISDLIDGSSEFTPSEKRTAHQLLLRRLFTPPPPTNRSDTAK